MKHTNLLKWLPLFAIALWPLHLNAQYKKVPDPNRERNEVNNSILKGNYKGYKVVEIKLSEGGKMDTSTVSDYRFYSTGLLKSASQYEYAKPDDIGSQSEPYMQHLGKLETGAEIVFTYDAEGNMLSKRNSLIFPANSYMAVMQTAMKENVKSLPDNYMDALLAKGVPEIKSVRESVKYIYNKDNNPVYSKDSVDNKVTIYKYTYDKEKRVVQQRQTSYEKGSSRATRVVLYHFGYDKASNLDTIIAYNSFMDTVDVTNPRNRSYELYRTYNDKGRLVKEDIAAQQSGLPQISYFAYTDTLITGSVSINHTYLNDTSAMVEKKYDNKNRPISEKRIRFNDGNRYHAEREEYTYDSAGNVAEIRYYQQDLKTPGNEIFYRKSVVEMY